MNPVTALTKMLQELGLVTTLPDPSVFEVRPEGPIKVLSRLGLLEERPALERIAQALGIEFLDLADPTIQSKITTKKFASQVNAQLCWKHKVVPLWLEGSVVAVACANPLDQEGRKAIEFSLTKFVRLIAAEESKIVNLLNEFFPPAATDFDQLADVEPGEYVEVLNLAGREEVVDEQEAGLPPIVSLGNKIMVDAVKANASDIHIEPTAASIEVRFRVDGVMQSIFEIPKRLQSHLVSRFKLLAGMDIAERRRPQDGRLRIRVAAEPVDMRVSCVPTTYGEKIVMRLLRSEAQELNFDSLGFSEDFAEKLMSTLTNDGKLFLVTGPTGSGKTTTLYACLNYLKDGTSNIETVEDPIEYRIPGINQIQVNETINVTFASALRSILRQDPDVIMIGEIRDSETAQIAVQAAQTGHLVLSTLHTNDSPSVVSRLINLGVEPYTLANALSGVMAQRLVRRICSKCAQELSDATKDKWDKIAKEHGLDLGKLRWGNGCPECNYTGYRGRVALFSYLHVSPTIADAIEKRTPVAQIIELAKQEGFIELEEAAIKLVRDGISTLEEVRPYISTTAVATKKAVKAEGDSAKKGKTIKVEPSSDAEKKAAGLTKQKVVLIEDDADVRHVIALVLQKEMFEVFEANNGLEGLNLVYEHTPDLVLCDLMMPVMDGREFLLRMRTNVQTREIPIVMLTAVDTEENEVDLMDLGANDFVSKASSAKVMLTRIRRALR